MTVNEKRNVPRKPASLDIRFAVTDFGGRHASRVEARGSIVDISDEGFGMITSYPLKKGHAITIKGGGDRKGPAYGLVKWTVKAGTTYRAGLCHRHTADL